MSQTYNPYGLSLVSYKGSNFSATTSNYTIASGYAVPLGAGDPVAINSANGCIVRAQNATATHPDAATAPILGVFMGVTYRDISGNTIISEYWTAGTQLYPNTQAIAQVNDLPYCTFKIQSSTQVTQAQALGINFDFNVANASASTKSSQFGLNTAAPGNAGDNFGFCTVIGLADPMAGQTNNWGDPFVDLIVLINNHRFKAGTIAGAIL